MQPYQFLIYIKQYLNYSDRQELSTLSNLTINQVYHLLNKGIGKKNSLPLSKAAVELLGKKGITDKTIKDFSKKFATKTVK